MRLGPVLLAALVSVSSATGSAQADEVYPAPPTAWDVTGVGWGHGVGLSQWGAQGAALQGLSYEHILGHYYPGTVLTSQPDRLLRVQLSAFAGGAVWFSPPSPLSLTVSDAGTGRSAVVTAGARFGVLINPSFMRLVRVRADGSLEPVDVAGGADMVGPVDITGAGSVLLHSTSTISTGRQYRGSVRIVRTGSGSGQAVNLVSIEDYLRGVVPREMSPSWRPAALRAQAVAARSYALAVAPTGTATSWDICDTTACQAYGDTPTCRAGRCRCESIRTLTRR